MGKQIKPDRTPGLLVQIDPSNETRGVSWRVDKIIERN